MNDRIYTIVATAKDVVGNTTSVTATCTGCVEAVKTAETQRPQRKPVLSAASASLRLFRS